jgi:hypothetical protein
MIFITKRLKSLQFKVQCDIKNNAMDSNFTYKYSYNLINKSLFNNSRSGQNNIDNKIYNDPAFDFLKNLSKDRNQEFKEDKKLSRNLKNVFVIFNKLIDDISKINNLNQISKIINKFNELLESEYKKFEDNKIFLVAIKCIKDDIVFCFSKIINLNNFAKKN